MSAVEILRQARELIADKSRWTQGKYARDKNGDDCLSTSSAATCWCANGAFFKAAHAAGLDVVTTYTPLDAAAHELADSIAEEINDGDSVYDGMQPHDAVLKLYDFAINKAEAEAANE